MSKSSGSPDRCHAGGDTCPPNKPQAYVDEDGTPYKYVVAAGPASRSLWKAEGQQWTPIPDTKAFGMMGVTAAGLVKAAEQGYLTKCSVDAIEFEMRRLRPVHDT